MCAPRRRSLGGTLVATVGARSSRAASGPCGHGAPCTMVRARAGRCAGRTSRTACLLGVCLSALHVRPRASSQLPGADERRDSRHPVWSEARANRGPSAPAHRRPIFRWRSAGVAGEWSVETVAYAVAAPATFAERVRPRSILSGGGRCESALPRARKGCARGDPGADVARLLNGTATSSVGCEASPRRCGIRRSRMRWVLPGARSRWACTLPAFPTEHAPHHENSCRPHGDPRPRRP
jgi:hypothetical protein